MNLKPLSFNTGLCSKVCHLLECLYEFRPAVRVSAVIQGIDSDEDIGCAKHLGPSQGYRKKNGVSGWDIGNRDLLLHLFRQPSLWDVYVGGEGGTPDLPQVYINDNMAFCPKCMRNPFCRIKLNAVSLAVSERDCIRLKPLCQSNGKGCSGVKPSA